MKKLAMVLVLVLVLGTMAVPALAESVAEKAAAYFTNYDGSRAVIKVPDLFAKIDAGEDMLIIDVRQPDVYAEGHLKGAVNVPFGPAVAENLKFIPDDVQLYVNCYTGQTSSQVVALLNVAGKFATNIQFGWNLGISQAEGYEAYTETTENVLPGDEYDVDPEIQAAIEKYFADTAANTGTAFDSNNFDVTSLMEIIDAEDDSYYIYSVRQAADYEVAHIPGAINNPYGAGMEQRFSELPTDKKIIVYCYTGQTASQTTAILRLMGYDAYNLRFGMGAEGGSGWLGAGYTTEP